MLASLPADKINCRTAIPKMNDTFLTSLHNSACQQATDLPDAVSQFSTFLAIKNIGVIKDPNWLK